ncbi:hypothetical protein C8046_08655 [Serinibacter arcticus]|uniref:Uncharacterized protein n=1 Tax=Serinibacter arcticus TaxID=1655435 RepID=A0A2U1ZUT0_9MICO|nr:hypothetical protein [Serinibacter arcticus]PWD50710.1 hypothetical protein C8046_08655 [Serinibacter arcticus]
MSTSEPVHPPSSPPSTSPATGAGGPDFGGPAAPVPPRSRGRAHLLGAALAVLGSLIGFVVLTYAVGQTGPAEPIRPLVVLAAVLAGGVLGSVATWGARSAAAPAIAGGLWTLLGAAGMLPSQPLDPLIRALPDLADGVGTDAVVTYLLASGVVLAIGVTFLGLATAVSIARRRGRAWERTELRLSEGGAVTTPPRPRILSHLGAIVASLVGAVVTVVALDSFVTARLALALPLDHRDALVPLALLVIAAFVTAVTGAMSSLGPAVGGIVWLISVVTGVLDGELGLGAVSDAVAPVLTDLLDLAEPGAAFVNAGAAWSLALVLVGGAVGSHHARRGGRTTERQEQQFIQSQDEAWSDSPG